MRRAFFVLILLMIWVQGVEAQSIITIEVQANGNALWTMEKRLPLGNQTEIDEWEEFIRKGQDASSHQKDIEDFIQRIDWFIHSAEKFSNRPMKAEKFDITYDTAKTPSASFGIIKYIFEWKNFSHAESSKILIGDAFSEGMVLSSDNVLVVKIPDGFDIEKTSPNYDKRDGNRLIWDGTLYRNFNKGEPALALIRSGIGQASWLLIGIIIVGLISGGSLILFKRGRPAIESGEPDSTPIPELTKEDLENEEIIEKFLVKSGGQAYQSDIVKEIGVSKSTISIVLAKMKDEGRILKIRKGKENIIRLANK